MGQAYLRHLAGAGHWLLRLPAPPAAELSAVRLRWRKPYLWHGREALKSRQQFTALRKDNRDAVIRFLKSI
jgi:hypothetical protein